MSMTLQDILEFDYFPYYTKEQILEEVKSWVNPKDAEDYVLKNYDEWRKKHQEFLKQIK